MNENAVEPQTEAEIVAAWFVETEVKEWLIARAALYQIDNLVLKIDSGKDSLACTAGIGLHFEYGPSFDAAVSNLKQKLPTALTLREQAALLLHQAAELEAKKEPVDDELRTEGKKSQAKPNIHA